MSNMPSSNGNARRSGDRPARPRAFESDEIEHHHGPRDQAIDEISDRSTQKTVADPKKAPLVIPLIAENQWRDKPEANDTDGKSETVSLTKTWGLILPKKRKAAPDLPSAEHDAAPTDADTSPPSDGADGPVSESAAPRTEEQEAIDTLIAAATGQGQPVQAVPIIMQNRVPGIDHLADEVQKYRHDVSLRPDDTSLDDYDDVPVEAFGDAMLRGMGWKEGKAVGRNPIGVIFEPIVHTARPQLLGLGATPAPVTEKKARLGDVSLSGSKDGKTDGAQKDKSSDYRSKSTRFRKGDRVDVTYGRYKGYGGEIVELRDRDVIMVRIRRKGKSDVVKVYEDELDLAEESDSHDDDRGHGGKPKKTWMRPYLRLRVVSRSFKRGRYDDMKCTVQDVLPSGEAIVRFDNGEVVEGVRESHVETYIPGTGKPVMVVVHSNPEYVGQTGKILEKDRDNERAVVQLDQDFEVVTVEYDHITEITSDHAH
ncbi:DExH-box splicing factor binding site-domain-containing protein [Polychytrium aggregatum]|uniref:DExH-box splicing factor binding site-domain-containing protein n=1 Tax=Polychytrium aggregatum TaxID=110093 RepID=UPI0022FE850D|nr:DExH-box splicing factor binding site-domain-containing protein [Polychytrium aggregatum]KAI9209669.1 DExH-box splicing factor binding site-domain-containing protein [Polychytrium aggregatum]